MYVFYMIVYILNCIKFIACAITTNTLKKMLSVLPKKCKILNVYKELNKIQNIFQSIL